MILSLIITASVMVLFAKSENAFRNQLVILRAIHLHNKDCIASMEYDKIVPYSAVEPPICTVAAFDWGYDKLVDAKTFEAIRPYIKKGCL